MLLFAAVRLPVLLYFRLRGEVSAFLGWFDGDGEQFHGVIIH